MKRFAIYSAIVLLVAGTGACKKILDRVDFNGVPGDVVWENESTATLYLNNLYNLVMPVWPSSYGGTTLPTAIHNISDDANGGTTTVIYGTTAVTDVTDIYTSGTNTAYGYIRKINILLTSIDAGGLPDSTRDKIKAQAYFLRAWVYFQLVKIYGGVPYLTHPQDWITEDLNIPRNKTSECVDSMLTDLAHCSILPTTWSGSDFGRITKVAALALKGKILLYWASPQFNDQANDPARWERAYQANRAAYDSLTKYGYALYPKFGSIFLDCNTAGDKEPILFRSYISTTVSGQFNTYDNVTRPYSQSAGSGGKTNNPTWNLVSAFPMSDGRQPGDPAATVTYDPTYYWLNRDPRFYATIAYNGCFWGLGNSTGRRQWMYTGIPDDKSAPSVTGFYCRKNIDSTIVAANTANGKTYWVEMRLAEVMLNLAECANMTNRQSESYDMLTAIRKRAGIPAGAGSLYGLKAAMSQPEMQSAIMLERRIEFAFEGKRYDDLRRTRTFDALNGQTRQMIVITLKSPYISTTDTTKKLNNLEYMFKPGIRMRDTIDVNGPDYTKYFTFKVQTITGESAINWLLKFYAYAIPPVNIAKDPNMAQTLDWGGTFDYRQ